MRMFCSAIVYLLIAAKLSSAELVMPQWLRALSGLKSWPLATPPYVAEAHHNLSAIEAVPLREYGICLPELNETRSCSFDCNRCLAADDVYTCSPMSQTFDDGPSAATLSLLDALKRRRSKTTFFLIGTNVVERPEIVRREHREGHVVAVHTWTHRFLPALSNEEVFGELQWCIWAINASTGVVPRYFRPPYGGLDNRIRSIARQLGLTTVMWDLDTNDWQLNEGSRTSAEVVSDIEDWSSKTSERRWFYFRTKTKGLMLEHDLTAPNVELAIDINAQLPRGQKTVAQCVRKPKYQ